MPKTALVIGDSISGGYAPLVAKELAAAGIAMRHQFNGDSPALLVNLPDWLKDGQPDLIHFNCGLHDARFFRHSEAYQQPIANYDLHLRGVVKWLRANTTCHLIWASTTPVITERITLHYVRFNPDIIAYNTAALRIMDEAHIPINDLYAAIEAHSTPDCLGPDGVHMTGRANEVLAAAVAGRIIQTLQVA